MKVALLAFAISYMLSGITIPFTTPSLILDRVWVPLRQRIICACFLIVWLLCAMYSVWFVIQLVGHGD